ncbi:MAG: radical SAM protein [Candidatus Methanosuratincola sp.]|jgi:7-carboxy-7-deazaguanine synthase
MQSAEEEKLRISEIFYSIQGEGLDSGLPTVFVRLYGCDLRCSWCDTMYAVEGGDFTLISVGEIVKKALWFDCKRACITGGEPLLQWKGVEQLTKELLDTGFRVVLETAGHKMPPPIFADKRCTISLDCKCPSSLMEGSTLPEAICMLKPKDQLKFVIKDDTDYEYAKSILDRLPIEASVVFQPVFGTDPAWLAECVLRDRLNSVRVLPQLHKLLWGERRGV